MAAVAELINPEFKLEQVKDDSPCRFNRVHKFAGDSAVDGVAGLVSPQLKLEELKGAPRSQFHRVERFIRYGVDKIMEGHKKHKTLFPACTHHGRVSYFTASRVERPKEEASGPIKPLTTLQTGHRHVDYFRASGIAKGEGNVGGGIVTDMLNIGFNPRLSFQEVRVKRQRRVKEDEGSKQQEGSVWNKKLNPLDRKTSSQILRINMQKKEAASEIYANREYKMKQKEELDREKQEEYEKMKTYNPWGLPSVGVPKVTKSGRLYTHLCGMKMDNEDIGQKPKADHDMWLLLSGREGLLDKYRGSCSGCNKVKRRQDVSEFEKNKLLKEKERQEYYVKYLEEQKSKKHDSTEVKEEKIVPSDFIWGRTDVNRNMSGKLYPRTRQLYQLDHGDCSKGFGTYFSVADKIARLPEHFPFRGKMNYDSYQTWGKPGSAALMKNVSNRNAGATITSSSEAAALAPIPTSAEIETGDLCMAPQNGTSNRNASVATAPGNHRIPTSAETGDLCMNTTSNRNASVASAAGNYAPAYVQNETFNRTAGVATGSNAAYIPASAQTGDLRMVPQNGRNASVAMAPAGATGNDAPAHVPTTSNLHTASQGRTSNTIPSVATATGNVAPANLPVSHLPPTSADISELSMATIIRETGLPHAP